MMINVYQSLIKGKPVLFNTLVDTHRWSGCMFDISLRIRVAAVSKFAPFRLIKSISETLQANSTLLIDLISSIHLSIFTLPPSIFIPIFISIASIDRIYSWIGIRDGIRVGISDGISDGISVGAEPPKLQPRCLRQLQQLQQHAKWMVHSSWSKWGIRRA